MVKLIAEGFVVPLSFSDKLYRSGNKLTGSAGSTFRTKTGGQDGENITRREKGRITSGG